MIEYSFLLILAAKFGMDYLTVDIFGEHMLLRVRVILCH